MPIIEYDRDFRWLPVLVAAVAGTIVMVLLFFIIRAVISSDASSGVSFAAGTGMIAFSFLVAGFIAGIWTIQRALTHGANAALIVGIAAIIFGFIIDFFEGYTVGEIIITVLMYLIPGMIIGALGGFVGSLIRR